MKETFREGVTVVVASYNHEKFVEAALDSVFRQTLPPVRVIVTDDASRDASQETIKRLVSERGWEVTLLLHEKNRGICATFNEALELVDTEFVAFIAADDYMRPDRLRRQVACFESLEEDIAVVHTDLEYVDESGAEMGRRWSDVVPVPSMDSWTSSRSRREVFTSNWIAAPSATMRTAAVVAVGGYDEALAFEDLDMWMRLSVAYRFAYLPEPLTFYRQLGDSLGRRIDADGTVLRDRIALLFKHTTGTDDEADWIAEQVYAMARGAFERGVIDAAAAGEYMRPHAIRSKRAAPWARILSLRIRQLARRPRRSTTSEGAR